MTRLLLLALAPAAILLHYVWKKDKSKEPTKLLVKLILLGALACIPAGFIELFLDNLIKEFFKTGTYPYYFVSAFIGVALIEEGFKFVSMYQYTHKNKEFDGLFDGMIYAIFVSLGFAAFENVFYVMDSGVSTALARAVMAVPGHMFFAVFMGYNYSMWHTYKLCDESEKYFANLNMIKIRPPKYKYKHYLFLSLLLPTLVHGFYDFCLFTENETLALVLLATMVVLYISCFARIKKLSKADMQDYQLIPLILVRKYPELIGVITPRVSNPLSVPQNYYTQKYVTKQ